MADPEYSRGLIFQILKLVSVKQIFLKQSSAILARSFSGRKFWYSSLPFIIMVLTTLHENAWQPFAMNWPHSLPMQH